MESSSKRGAGNPPAALLAGDFKPDDVFVVLSTAPDMLLAKRLAHLMVEERLAACVNLGGPGVSMYMWQGTLEGADEVSLTMKTTGGRLQALADRLIELHPYEVPELIVLPVPGGSVRYLDWVRTQCSSVSQDGDSGTRES